MRIRDYMSEIRPAVEVVIGEIHAERQALDNAEEKLSRLTKETEAGYRKVEFLQMNPELDDDFLGTAIYWDTYFGPDKDRWHANIEVEKIEEQIQVKAFSLSALGGTLLQFGKQGISLQYGGIDTCPPGREIEGMSLRDLIWFGRNQGIHWDEGEFRGATKRFLEQLGAAKGGPFSDYKSKSLSLDIINLIGWKTTDQFQNDLLSLDP